MSESVAAMVATAVAPSATFAVAAVVHAGAWSLVSVMVTVIVCAVAVLAASVAASTTTQVSESPPDPQAGVS